MAETLREIDFDHDDLEGDCCTNCGGEGYILAADGDGTDWGEDTYAGPLDAEIKCRHCNGLGFFRRTSTTTKGR